MNFTLISPAATAELAVQIARMSKPGDVICLYGDLGSGKTHFARAFITALDSRVQDVPSPTFTLVQTYECAGVFVWHFDLYRLEYPEEIFELGLDQAQEEGISLIEWPERLGPLLPGRRLELHFTQGAKPQMREVKIVGRESPGVLGAGDEKSAATTWPLRLANLSQPLKKT